jgi:hypothetical protein
MSGRRTSETPPVSTGAGLKIVGVVLVFVLVAVSFLAGVETSGLEATETSSILAWIYYAAGLFVFGGLDLGTPVGGPIAARGMMWIAYFLAPAIMTTTVAEAVIRLVRPARSALGSVTGHLILVGAGPIGLAYLQAVRRVDPDIPVLLVDRFEGDATLAEAERLGGVHPVSVDPRRPAALEVVELERADRMVVVTDDDLTNLEVAWAARAARADLPIAVHVADLTLLRPVNRLVRDQARVASSGGAPPLVFNTHRIGALHLYERFLHPHFEDTRYRDVVVLGGFGRFSQTILELLRVTAADEIERLVVVDPDASRKVRQFTVDVPLEVLSFTTVDGDLEDPGTWARVDDEVAGLEATPVYLLASSDEVVNFRAAMLLRARSSEPRVFARCFHRGQFAESLAEQRDFELLAFEEVLRDALVEHYEGLKTV